MSRVIKNKNGLILSPRSKVRLTSEEMEQLKEYVDYDPAAFTNITNNTDIHRDTVKAGLKRGWFEAGTALKLRTFLKAIKDNVL